MLELDKNCQRIVYCLRNKWEKYITPGDKLTPLYGCARIFTTKSAAVRAVKYFRTKLNDDSIHILRLVLTIREF